MKFKNFKSILIASLLVFSFASGCGAQTPAAQAPAQDNAAQTNSDTDTSGNDPYIRGGSISPYYTDPNSQVLDNSTTASDNSAATIPSDTADTADSTLITPAIPVRVFTDLYVSTYGNDNNDGSKDSPLATIQQAIDMISPGHTIYIMSGIYKGANTFDISGTSSDPITITHAPDANASSVMISLGYGEEGAIFDVNGQNNLRFVDLRIGDSTANWVYGIYIPKESNNIWIEETEFMNLNAPDIGAAYGILMYGDGSTPEEAIHDIYIYDNEVHGITTGQGMGIAGSGNLNTITIDGNHVYSITNHGIDVYGGGRTTPVNSLDQPTDIIIRGNEVHNCTAYNELSCSGILVDGTMNTSIEDNYVYECPCGIEICSENYNYDYPTTNVTATRNTVHDNHDMGISIGGYNQNYYGVVRNSEVSENILYNNGYRANDGANGEIHFEKCDNIIVRDNIIRNHDYAYPVIGCGKTSEYVKNVSFNNNLYAYDKPEKIIFRFQGNVYIGLDNWNKFTGGSDVNTATSGSK